jgi:hypothetical protein
MSPLIHVRCNHEQLEWRSAKVLRWPPCNAGSSPLSTFSQNQSNLTPRLYIPLFLFNERPYRAVCSGPITAAVQTPENVLFKKMYRYVCAHNCMQGIIAYTGKTESKYNQQLVTCWWHVIKYNPTNRAYQQNVIHGSKMVISFLTYASTPKIQTTATSGQNFDEPSTICSWSVSDEPWKRVCSLLDEHRLYIITSRHS